MSSLNVINKCLFSLVLVSKYDPCNRKISLVQLFQQIKPTKVFYLCIYLWNNFIKANEIKITEAGISKKYLKDYFVYKEK